MSAPIIKTNSIISVCWKQPDMVDNEGFERPKSQKKIKFRLDAKKKY